MTAARHMAVLFRSNHDCLTCRYAYMEYVSETAAAEAAKKHQDVELSGNKLYVIKSMINELWASVRRHSSKSF